MARILKPRKNPCGCEQKDSSGVVPLRCKAKKKDGTQCIAFSLIGEDRCIFHSNSLRAQAAKKRRKILSLEELIFILQKQIKKLERSDCEQLEKTRMIRQIVETISELKGEKDERLVEQSEFEKKLEKWQKNQT